MAERQFEVLTGAVVWRSTSGPHSLNTLRFDQNSNVLAKQAASINFEEQVIAFGAVPTSLKDQLVLVTKQEVALVELSSSHGIQEKASIRIENEIESEVHQLVVTTDDQKNYLEIAIMHD